MHNPTIDIIIVNWNSGRQLRACLESVVSTNRDGFVLERVTIVDNASEDDSAYGLEDIDLPLFFIRNSENCGFAAACNQGAKESKADYLLFLNPDTELFRESLTKPLAFIEKPQNKDIGICGVKLVNEKGEMVTSCAHCPTLKIFFGKMTGLTNLFPAIFPDHFMSAFELNRSRSVDQVIGAFFLVRKSLFDELNGFDERFFVYYEEVDFSIRAKCKGYSSYYLSDVMAFHRGGGTTNEIRATRLFYSLRSRMQYACKHYSRIDSILLILLTLTVEFVSRMVFSILHRSIDQILDVFDAYKNLLSHFVRRGIFGKDDR